MMSDVDLDVYIKNLKQWSDDDLDEEGFEVKMTIIDEFVNNASDGELALKYKAIIEEQVKRQEEKDKAC